MLHPDILLEQLTAEQIIEWRAAYDHAPWGELRADMRGVAHAAMSMGQRGLRPTWPYVETLDMIEQEFVEIAKQTGEDPERVRELMRRHRGRDSS